VGPVPAPAATSRCREGLAGLASATSAFTALKTAWNPIGQASTDVRKHPKSFNSVKTEWNFPFTELHSVEAEWSFPFAESHSVETEWMFAFAEFLSVEAE